jgi:hypothetical protein
VVEDDPGIEASLFLLELSTLTVIGVVEEKT